MASVPTMNLTQPSGTMSPKPNVLYVTNEK